MPFRISILALIIISGFCNISVAQAVRVRLIPKPGGGSELSRGDAPYFVKGVGLDKGSIATAAEFGANCARTWGSDQLGQILDEAQRNNMTVCAGIWLGHERHGFRYNDPAQVARQKEDVRRVVELHKNHPALLVWGLGNEMEGDGKNPDVWNAVEDIAKMVKQLDPDHPTMTVISEFGDDPAKIRGTHDICKNIDIVGLNSYGSVATLAKRYQTLGGTKPYLLTEFGPRGWWESERKGDAPLEPTSTEKAGMYRLAYESAVLGQPGCLGSYAFLWGWKQEATTTWFGLVLPSGERVGAVDVLARFWTGKSVENLCPTVQPLKLVEPAAIRPGARLRILLEASDPEGDRLDVSWELREEGKALGGGDAEPEAHTLPSSIIEASPHAVTIELPATPAPRGYRIYAIVKDTHKGAATANLPLVPERAN